MGRPKIETSRASTVARLMVGEEHTQEFELASLQDAPAVKRSAIKMWGNAGRSHPARRFSCRTETMFQRDQGIWVRLTIKRLA